MTLISRSSLLAIAVAAAVVPAARADMAKLLQMMADHTLCCGSFSGIAAKHAPGQVQLASIPAGVTPPAPAKPVEGRAAPSAGKEFERVGFELLAAYNYQAPSYDGTAAKPKPDQIPDYVKALDKKKIAITGFMLPTKFKDGRVTEFLLMKDQSGCCFGAMPRINEWVIVKMNNGGVPPLMDVPLTFIGTLKVGEVFEEGYLSGVYQLDGEKLLES
jgi:hypothetical protein